MEHTAPPPPPPVDPPWLAYVMLACAVVFCLTLRACASMLGGLRP